MQLTKTLVAALSAAFLLTACEQPGAGSGDTSGTGGTSGGGNGVYGSGVSELAPGVADRVFYAYDSAMLDSEAQATLQAQAGWLKENGSINVTVEGHCDERGTREYNLALGERRASAAKKYLVSLGVSPGRISTISYGKERPAAPGSDEASWAQNRRAVTVVANK